MDKESTYIPGTCNIGPAEIAKRKRAGYWLIALNLVLIFAFLNNDIARIWRWLMLVPITVAAIAWLQVYFRFCVAFSWYGVYNFGSLTDKKTRVQEDEWLKADKARAQKVILLAIAVSLLLTVAFYLL